MEGAARWCLKSLMHALLCSTVIGKEEPSSGGLGKYQLTATVTWFVVKFTMAELKVEVGKNPDTAA